MDRLIITLITVFGIINIFRITFYMVGSDIYAIRQKLKTKNRSRRWHTPEVTAIIPAHNEEKVIESAIDSIQASDYPKSKLQIVVVNDGSTDNTVEIVKSKIKQYKKLNGFEMKLSNQRNKGKASALNRAIKLHAKGSIIMCLDADSLIDPMAIRKAVQHFRDRKVVALASNVNIIENGTLLGLVQRFEFIVAYQMKKAQTTFNVEYIIGGIGSFFRKSILENVNYYDTNTMTEDIDLTMKIIAKGNKKQRVAYAADAITYTEPAPSYKSLIRQRFRWKYGRMQTFFKNRQVFMNTNKKYSRLLTLFVLPYAIVQELVFFLEPLFLGFILYTSARYRDVSVFLFAGAVIMAYISLNIWSTQHLKFHEKIRLTLYAPAAYVLFHLLTFVEYAALLISMIKLPGLKKSIATNNTAWKSPTRTAVAGKS